MAASFRTFALALAAHFLLLGTDRVSAFGPDGHSVIAKIAENHLTPRAKAGLKALIQDRSISDVRICTWPDLIRGSSAAYERKYPKNDMWHYIGLAIGVENQSVEGLAEKENHVAAAVNRFEKVLADPKQSDDDRREALYFIVHFVGDLHQPMHCGSLDNDRGGNLRKVTYPGDASDRLNLHWVWDSNLVREAMGGLEPLDYANRLDALIPMDKLAEWQKGEAADWVMEGNRLCEKHVYKGISGNAGLMTKFALTPDYVKESVPVIPPQLQKAGLRLAKVINRCFPEPAVP